jgi:hypothetical protein
LRFPPTTKHIADELIATGLYGQPRPAGLVSRECKAVNSAGRRLLARTKEFQPVGTSMGDSRGDERSIKVHRGISQMGTIDREKTPCA